jgi:DNA mismatch endonuclease (patch repair protein)
VPCSAATTFNRWRSSFLTRTAICTSSRAPATGDAALELTPFLAQPLVKPRMGVDISAHRVYGRSSPSMIDPLSKQARSAHMARIRQKSTAPEMVVRRFLHSAGLRYVLHPRALPGRPDIAFPKRRVAVFVHGCYWHGHTCRAGRAPATNLAYWGPKLAENKERDARKAEQLTALGWKVLTVWGCELKESGSEDVLGRLAEAIRKSTEPRIPKRKLSYRHGRTPTFGPSA